MIPSPNSNDNVFQVIFYNKNRKMYCKQTRAYVTLSNIYDMYRNNLCLCINEYETNKEITKEILVKAIMNFGVNYETKVKLLSKILEN